MQISKLKCDECGAETEGARAICKPAMIQVQLQAVSDQYDFCCLECLLQFFTRKLRNAARENRVAASQPQ